MHNYHDVHQVLPDGCFMPYAVNGNGFCQDVTRPFGPNWAVYILPFLEQEGLYEQANPALYLNISGLMNPLTDPGAMPGVTTTASFLNTTTDQRIIDGSIWRNIGGVVIKTYQCPMDANNGIPYNDTTGVDCVPAPANPIQQAGPGWARGNYAATCGFTDTDHTTDGAPCLTNNPFDGKGKDGIVPNVAPPGPPVSKGPIFFFATAIGNGTRLNTITDGLSTTIMINEVRAGVSPLDIRGTWAIGHAGASTTQAGRAYNPTPNNNLESVPGANNPVGDEMQGCYKFWQLGIGTKDRMGCFPAMSTDPTDLPDQQNSAMARSMHVNGLNAGMADGSVRWVSNAIDQWNWCILQSKDDGYTALIPEN
jgi:hypothetical protein